MSARELLATAAQHDDGAADPALVTALATGDEIRVRAALAGARVFAAIEARLLEADGSGADKESEMALVAVRAASGATALPVFSGIAALAVWRPGARPVAVNGAAVAVEALRLGHEALLVDPGSVPTAVIDGPDLAVLAAGEPSPAVRPARGPEGADRRRLRRALRSLPADVYPLDLVDAGGSRPALGVAARPGAPPDLLARVAAAVGPVTHAPVDLVPLDPQTAERLRAAGAAPLR